MSGNLLIQLAVALLFALDLLKDRLLREMITRSRIAQDITFATLNTYFTRPVCSALIGYVVLKFSRFGVLHDQSLGLRVAIAFVGMEIIQYFTHRALHSRWLWSFHAIHHQPDQISSLSAGRLHPVNFALTQVRNLVLVFISLPPAAVFALLVYPTIYTIVSHSRWRLHFGALEYLLVSPASHHWHHSSAWGETKNFGVVLGVWDWLFGTLKLSHGRFPTELGAPGFTAETFLEQLWKPLPACWASVFGRKNQLEHGK